MRAAKVVSSVAYNYLGTVFISLSGFAYTAFIVHRLTHSRFGILVLTTSIISYSSLLDLGIGITVMKMVAERTHKESIEETTTIVRNALMIFAVIGVVAFAIILCLEPFVGVIFKISGENLHVFRIALAIAGLGLGLSFPSAIYTALHQAYGDYRYVNVLALCIQVVQVSCGIVLLLAHFGIVALVTLNAVLSVGAFVIKARHARTKFEVRVRRAKFSRSIARTMFSMSVWVFLMNLATQIIFSTDNLVVGVVLGTSAVASYQVALGPASSLQAAGDQFNMVSLTTAATLRAQSATEDLQRLLLEATRIISAVALPGMVVFAIWGRQLLSLWVGPSFEASDATLVVLAAGYLVAAVNGAPVQVILALDRYRLVSLLSLGEAVTNLILSVVLARHIGIVGVALGTTVPLTIMVFGCYIPFACRLIGLPYRRLLRRLLLPLMVNALAYGILRLVASAPHLFTNLLTLLAAAIAVFALCFSASILLDPVERVTYLNMLRRFARGQRS